MKRAVLGKGMAITARRSTGAWGKAFASLHELNMLVDAGLNIVTGVPTPNVSVWGDVVGDWDFADNGDPLPDIVPNHPDFGSKPVVTFSGESLPSSIYQLLSGSSKWTILVAGGIRGYFFSSDSFDLCIQVGDTYVRVFLNGNTNYRQLPINPNKPFIIIYDDSQAGFAKLVVYQDGYITTGTDNGLLPAPMPILSASFLAGRIASTYGWGQLAMLGIKVGSALVDVPGAYAAMAARFADGFWGEILGGVTTGRSFKKTAASLDWTNDFALSKEAIDGDCIAVAKSSGAAQSVMFGLVEDGTAITSYTSIHYCVGLNYLGEISIYEEGVAKGGPTVGTHTPSDRITVERTGDTVTFKKNGSALYESLTSASGAYRLAVVGFQSGVELIGCDFEASAPPSWEDTFASVNNCVALYTAGSYVLSLGDRVDRLSGHVGGNMHMSRPIGVRPPTIVQSVPAVNGHPVIDFDGDGGVVTEGLEGPGFGAALSGASQATIFGVAYLAAQTWALNILLSLGSAAHCFISKHQGGRVQFYPIYSSGGGMQTNAVADGWYVFVISFDGTQGTSSDRVKIWLNGVDETDTELSTCPAAFTTMSASRLGWYSGLTYPFKGQVACIGASLDLLDPATLSAALNARFGVY